MVVVLAIDLDVDDDGSIVNNNQNDSWNNKQCAIRTTNYSLFSSIHFATDVRDATKELLSSLII